MKFPQRRGRPPSELLLLGPVVITTLTPLLIPLLVLVLVSVLLRYYTGTVLVLILVLFYGNETLL
jgi:hypothetical protein